MKKRDNFPLGGDVKFTCNLGQLVPICVEEVLPGDTFNADSRALIRVSPLLAPVMHKVDVEITHWFVPNRILWDDWEKFITGGPDGDDATVHPFVTVPVGGFDVGSLADYMGIPPDKGAGDTVNALPFRAYAAIFNEWFRDEDLVAELPLSKGNGSDTITNLDIVNAAWKKDYFTSARPWPQKGPAITIPLTGDAPVLSTGAYVTARSSGTPSTERNVGYNSSNQIIVDGSGTSGGQALFWGDETGLEADLSDVTAISIADLRLASAMQRYEENNARGNRYNEVLLHRFGVKSSDARLQIPEYLGGGRETIQFSEVLQTAPTTDGDDEVGVGNLKGHGIATIKSNHYQKFFEEHGFVISLMTVRPKAVYADGLHKKWSRPTKEDYFTPELQFIGNQEILNKEVDFAHASPDDTWGYQERYDEYKRGISRIAGEFRTVLDFYTYARIFDSPPALNGTFVTCTPTDRVYAVPSQNHLWINCINKINAKRLVSKSSRPRLM